MSFRFRLALAAGFCVGYYFGAKAGQERYKQIRQRLDRLQRSEIMDKAKAAVDLGVERVREAISENDGSAIGNLPA